MKKPIHKNLMQQLISIAVITCGIIFLALGIVLPKVLLPVYEKNIYQYLKQPLELLRYDLDDNKIASDIAYLYVTSDNVIVASDNFTDVIKSTPKQVISKIDREYGKFNYLGKTYYYNTSYNEYVKKISLTNDEYIVRMKQDILYVIFPILLITLLLITGLIVWWSRRLVVKIEKLKEKVDNLDNDDYVDNDNYVVDDELKALSVAIDEMKMTLKKEEEYKSQMYQNISHDFKTPLTVMKSYIEAVDDGVQDKDKALSVIREQVDKLELKVHSLLYLNKLNYIKDSKQYKEESINVAEVIRNSIEKFKIQRPELTWKIQIADKKVIFNGSYDMWASVVDNFLGNFMRYAETTIKITMKNGKITFYNDGPNIDETILDDIFTPYKKGIKGEFGLGLSIIKKTLALCGYEVTVKNEKKGVSFMIK